MENPKLVKVVRMGRTPTEVATHEGMSVTELLRATGNEGFNGTIYAQEEGSNRSDVLAKDSVVNGYSVFILANEVKGA